MAPSPRVGLEDDSEKRYKAVLAAREAEKERRERAIRDELKGQNAGQPDLEKRYAKQEAEREREREQAREERKREETEREVGLLDD